LENGLAAAAKGLVGCEGWPNAAVGLPSVEGWPNDDGEIVGAWLNVDGFPKAEVVVVVVGEGRPNADGLPNADVGD
jgi:hypothetical protein